MQTRRVVWLGVLVVVLLLIGTVQGVLVWQYPELVGLRSGGYRQIAGLWVIAVTTLVLVMCVVGYHFLGHQLGHSAYRQVQADDVPRPMQADHSKSLDADVAQRVSSIRKLLRARYGLFWRHKTRLLLIIGEPTEIEAIAPTLAAHQWLEGQGTVLQCAGRAGSIIP